MIAGTPLQGSAHKAGAQCRRLAGQCAIFFSWCAGCVWKALSTMVAKLWVWIWAQLTTRLGLFLLGFNTWLLKADLWAGENGEFSRSLCGFSKSKPQCGNHIPNFVVVLIDYYVGELCCYGWGRLYLRLVFVKESQDKSVHRVRNFQLQMGMHSRRFGYCYVAIPRDADRCQWDSKFLGKGHSLY